MEVRLQLSRGAGFLLYTDGLVERRRQAIDVGLQRLLAEVEANRDASPPTLTANLLRLLDPGERDDDACAMAVSLSG